MIAFSLFEPINLLLLKLPFPLYQPAKTTVGYTTLHYLSCRASSIL